jgi:hypothetical protein
MQTISRTLFCLVVTLVLGIDLSSGTTLEGPPTCADNISFMAKPKLQASLDVNGYSTAPDSLELKQVHVFVRHGAQLAMRFFEPSS